MAGQTSTLGHDFHEVETLPENDRVRYTSAPPPQGSPQAPSATQPPRGRHPGADSTSPQKSASVAEKEKITTRGHFAQYPAHRSRTGRTFTPERLMQTTIELQQKRMWNISAAHRHHGSQQDSPENSKPSPRYRALKQSASSAVSRTDEQLQPLIKRSWTSRTNAENRGDHRRHGSWVGLADRRITIIRNAGISLAAPRNLDHDVSSWSKRCICCTPVSAWQ